jgi:hypothetical protein
MRDIANPTLRAREIMRESDEFDRVDAPEQKILPGRLKRSSSFEL